MKKYKWEQEQIKDMKEYIARFGHGSAKLARQAQSKEKTLAKMVCPSIAWPPWTCRPALSRDICECCYEARSCALMSSGCLTSQIKVRHIGACLIWERSARVAFCFARGRLV